ncbi:MAG: ThuA domain-containing protein [Thermoanaerobaculia bacterium]|nr:ThuA domain-containing protein [Thermoanaerobaculia bacterium]
MNVHRLVSLGTLLVVTTSAGLAQQLPAHSPLRILIVSDEVNPHGLPPEDLTQPGEISAALLALPNLQLQGDDPILEIATDSLETATALLGLPSGDPGAYDVLVYFAHRIPNGGDGGVRQEAFVTAVDDFLETGGGVVSFHHGIYRTAGKESMQDLLGGEATGAVPWNTVDGQNVIAVAPDHFVTRYGIDYPTTLTYEDPGLGIPLADYPSFNNTPDERYPNLGLLPAAGEVLPLFASDYDVTPHLLGYVERRAQWTGVVVMYQPGEYQPHSLEPGNNFQILLNSILYAATDGGLLFADGFESGDTASW